MDYETISRRQLRLDGLSAKERRFLERVCAEYQSIPEWTAFASFWIRELLETDLPEESVAIRICHDLEARLGVAQGKVAPPDYRDYLADLIEERYGSRGCFCKETGIDPGDLSRVWSSRAELSIQSLQKIMATLDAVLVIQPAEAVRERLSPEDASRALAAAIAA